MNDREIKDAIRYLELAIKALKNSNEPYFSRSIESLLRELNEENQKVTTPASDFDDFRDFCGSRDTSDGWEKVRELQEGSNDNAAFKAPSFNEQRVQKSLAEKRPQKKSKYDEATESPWLEPRDHLWDKFR